MFYLPGVNRIVNLKKIIVFSTLSKTILAFKQKKTNNSFENELESKASWSLFLLIYLPRRKFTFFYVFYGFNDRLGKHKGITFLMKATRSFLITIMEYFCCRLRLRLKAFFYNLNWIFVATVAENDFHTRVWNFHLLFCGHNGRWLSPAYGRNWFGIFGFKGPRWMAREVRLLQRLSMETEQFWKQEDPDPYSWSKNYVSTATRTTAAAGSAQYVICVKKINLNF